MSIDEQIENLKAIGLIIEDEEYAKRVLEDISYFRLIKAYSLGLKEKNSSYHENVSFENIVQLYSFNSEFRHLLFPLKENVEISLRCKVANYFCEKYGVTGYLEKENFEDENHHQDFLDSINDELKRNSRAPFVKNFQENYEGGQLPLYALVEIISFGTLSKLYKNLKRPDKKAIGKQFGVGYTYFESWIESLAHVRNICAHYGRLYNAKIPKTPILYREYSERGIGNNRVFGTLLCLKHIYENGEEWNAFVEKLQKIIEKYQGADISTMGFPENWVEELKKQ